MAKRARVGMLTRSKLPMEDLMHHVDEIAD
jgi:hypothetical protein